MSRYRRYRGYRRYKGANKGLAEVLFVILLLPVYLIKWIIKGIVLLLSIKKSNGKKHKKNSQRTVNNTYSSAHSTGSRLYDEPRGEIQTGEETSYVAKDSLMTECEKKFFNVVKGLVGDNYIIQPQVNLASVVDKESARKQYRNELFRNIDIGIFDLNYKLIVLVEINDPSHETYQRKKRDAKVAEICKSSNIPLITFWTKFGIDEEYIKKRLKEYLPQI